jgi:hypothetical protein
MTRRDPFTHPCPDPLFLSPHQADMHPLPTHTRLKPTLNERQAGQAQERYLYPTERPPKPRIHYRRRSGRHEDHEYGIIQIEMEVTQS